MILPVPNLVLRPNAGPNMRMYTRALRPQRPKALPIRFQNFERFPIPQEWRIYETILKKLEKVIVQCADSPFTEHARRYPFRHHSKRFQCN